MALLFAALFVALFTSWVAVRSFSAPMNAVLKRLIETLQGIAWMLLFFFLVALFAYVVVRAFELRRKARSDAAPDMGDE